MRAGRRATLAVALAVAVGACGDDDKNPLAAAEKAMAVQPEGTIDLQLAASAGEEGEATGPVGFRLAGPFSLAADTDLAVFDLTYTRLLGDDEESTAVVSTGNEAFVTVEGTTYRVPEDDLGPLRLADEDDREGFGDLGIAGWVIDPKESEGESIDGAPTRRITGEVDAADLLSDLARMTAQLTGDQEIEPLDGDLAGRMQELVQASDFEAIVGADDHRLHSLRAVIDFGPLVPEVVRRSLGAYAGARIEVRLSLQPADGDLEVEAPEGFQDLG